MCCNSFKDLIIQYTTSIGSSPKIHDMWTARCEIICFIQVVKLLFHESIYISLSPYRKSYRYESLNQGWQSKVCRYSYKARKFLVSQYNTHLHLSYTKMRCGINTNETIINRITRLQAENNYRSPDGFNNEQTLYRKETNITIFINRCSTQLVQVLLVQALYVHSKHLFSALQEVHKTPVLSDQNNYNYGLPNTDVNCQQK